MNLSQGRTSFRELTYVSEEIWDTKVREECPHLDAYARADSARWNRLFLPLVDGVYSPEAVRTFIQAMNANPFRDPISLFVDKQRRVVKDYFSTSGNPPIVEVFNPYSVTSLAANGESGTVLNYRKEVRSDIIKISDDFEKTLTELWHSRGVVKGGPGAYIDSDEVLSADNEWLKKIGKYISRDEKNGETFRTLAGYTAGGIPSAAEQRAARAAARANVPYSSERHATMAHVDKALSSITSVNLEVSSEDKHRLATLLAKAGTEASIEIGTILQRSYRKDSIFDGLL